jgi:hypothetical protein
MATESIALPARTSTRPRGWLAERTATGRPDRYRRGLQIGLGIIWLLDAALQYQPYMFRKAFAHQILAPTGPGNPAWVARPVHWAAHLTAEHAVLADAAFATIQLLIALGFFSRKTVRLALAGSIVWALLIWWMGEGLGGLLAGPQSPVLGAPGAAVVYAFISILIWPRNTRSTETPSGSVATRSALGPIVARLAWLALWGSFAFESLQAANRSPSALHDIVAGNAAGEPAWLRAVDRGFASALAHHGTEVSIAFAIVFAFIAIAVFGGASMIRSGIVVAVVVAALIWLVGENLGEIATGTATDPNTGPLLILLAAAFWPLQTARREEAPAPDRLTARQLIDSWTRSLDNHVLGPKAEPHKA